jgi:hypothetical protein
MYDWGLSRGEPHEQPEAVRFGFVDDPTLRHELQNAVPAPMAGIAILVFGLGALWRWLISKRRARRFERAGIGLASRRRADAAVVPDGERIANVSPNYPSGGHE